MKINKVIAEAFILMCGISGNLALKFGQPTEENFLASLEVFSWSYSCASDFRTLLRQNSGGEEDSRRPDL